MNNGQCGPRRNCLRLSTIGLLACTLASILSAQNPRQIIEETQKRSRAKSLHYEGTLEVHDPKGKVSTRKWIFDRVAASGENKSILRFTAPPELKGVALLILDHSDGSSDQWMWTPAVDRERRIALQDRSTRFFGTDFSFEDLAERDVNQFDYQLLGQDTVDGAACWKIESKPKQSKFSQYTSSTLWVRQDNYVILQVESFGRISNQNKLIRKIHYTEIVKYDNLVTARKVEVWDAARNSRTVLTIGQVQYNLPMRAEDFTVEALRR